jgi:D-erythrulose 1-phosphate 3-epimerase
MRLESPKIFFAVDNCFASKRWVKPLEWIKIIKDAGADYIEASADTECDPLYTNAGYINQWIREIKDYSLQHNVKVANLYSGHGTYATIGLSHYDESVGKHILNNWLKKMADISDMIGAGMGFFCHAFPDNILQDPDAYVKAEDALCKTLAELAAYKNGLGVEQMYTPHQIPWTIDGAKRLMKKIHALSNRDFYITIDTGHQSAQQKFTRPGFERLKEWLDMCKKGERPDNMWLGPNTAYSLLHSAVRNSNAEDRTIRAIEDEMGKYPYLFAAPGDGDTYVWLENLACYSPIIHLQQTTGNSSSHLPFTCEHNANGIITGDKVLNAILNSYKHDIDTDMPARCSNIYLTLEIFSGTADINEDILHNLKESVAYWRQFIPKDGLRLEDLV